MDEKKEYLFPNSKKIIELLEPAILRRLQKEKRGQGFGKDYKPFLTVRDVPSQGRVHRRPSITHGRVVHLLSDLELAAFLMFDWYDSVVDIREQFPLDPERTIILSKRLGIKHPEVRGVVQIMTTDLLIDKIIDGRHITQAVSIKYHEELENTRVVEKLELERRFWEAENVVYYMFTENNVPETLIQNIKWLLPHFTSFDLDEKTQLSTFEKIHNAIEIYPEDKVAIIMKLLDEKEGELPGTYLQYFRHLLAQGAFHWDMTKTNHRSLRTTHIISSERWLEEDYEYVHAQ